MPPSAHPKGFFHCKDVVGKRPCPRHVIHSSKNFPSKTFSNTMEVYSPRDNPQELGYLGLLPNELMSLVWEQVGCSKFPFHARHLPPSYEELRTEATTQYRNQ